ncbi:hypothetical protein ACS0TY_005061 [Phlomoides rotata]
MEDLGKKVKEEKRLIIVKLQYHGHGKDQATILSFETDKTAPLRRIFLDFCDRLDIVYSTIRFLSPEGERIQEEQTAKELKMEDGEVIDAFSQQLGSG